MSKLGKNKNPTTKSSYLYLFFPIRPLVKKKMEVGEDGEEKGEKMAKGVKPKKRKLAESNILMIR